MQKEFSPILSAPLFKVTAPVLCSENKPTGNVQSAFSLTNDLSQGFWLFFGFIHVLDILQEQVSPFHDDIFF